MKGARSGKEDSRTTLESGGPPCPESQADGVPCEELGADCEDCDKAQPAAEGKPSEESEVSN